MSNISYTVYVKEKGALGEEIAMYNAKGKRDAEATAKKLAKEYEDMHVFIEFYRKSDGQHGYINPDGADLIGHSWTEE